jgi:hypothetical protein
MTVAEAIEIVCDAAEAAEDYVAGGAGHVLTEAIEIVRDIF